MPLTAVPAQIDGAPGNVITLPGTALLAGAGASVVLEDQNVVLPEWASTTNQWPAASTTSLINTFASSSVQFTIPDGAITGPLVITPDDGTGHPGMPLTLTLKVVSQYVQGYEYFGQGVDTSALAPASTTAPLYSSGGELDIILREASAYVDTWLGAAAGTVSGLRYQPYFETYPWRKSRRVYTYRYPVVSIDQFIVRISNFQTATISPNDIVINNGQRYVEILSYAVASYALLGAIQNLGMVANIVELNYHGGYKMQDYPNALKQAVIMTATELLNYRQIVAFGLGGLSSAKQGNQQFDRRSEGFQIPQPAKELLRPFVVRRLA